MKLEGSCHCGKVKFSVESHTPYPFMRCYCSICRKTAGGGGYAINIMGQTDTFKVKGKKYVRVYRVRFKSGKHKRGVLSTGQRHFCGYCASALWVYDPQWPELIHPFASAIDTDLPKSPETIHMMLGSAANWVDIPKGNKEIHFTRYPNESIEEWHKRHKLWVA